MHRLGITLLMGIASSWVGCARTLGPVPMPMARVRGVVHDGNGPVSGGWIEFMPVDGTVGNLRSARLGPDGSFDAEGVPVGEVAIRLRNDRIDQDRVLRLFGRFTSPIRRMIPAGPTASVKIDLAEEMIRLQQAAP